MIASAGDLPIEFFDQPTSYRGPRTVVLRSEIKTKGKVIIIVLKTTSSKKGRKDAVLGVLTGNNKQKWELVTPKK